MLLSRRKAPGKTLSSVFTKVNQVVRGWINYLVLVR
ncbi:group II intron maturase-specific domain-containing protein [uncultured Lactobacillus sp.]|nr:group II intron maturase-specific domain-containing protein [uncultured Lactobacillus sp.]